MVALLRGYRVLPPAIQPIPRPDAPANLTATPGVGQVVLDWDDLAGATSYVVQYADAGVGNWVTGATPSSSTVTLTSSTLTPGAAYDFRVAAVNAGGQGDYSNTATATPTDAYSLIANLARDWNADLGTFSDASATTPQTTDNGSVAAWLDQVAGDNASQSTSGSRPTLQTSEINGHSAIQFATDDWLSIATGVSLTAGHSIFIIFRQDGGDAGIMLADSDLQYFAYISANVAYYYDGGSGSAGHGTWAVDTWHCLESNRTTTPTWLCIKNGSQQGTADTGVTGAAIDVKRIGCRVSGSIPFNGRISRILIYSRLLTATEFTRVRTLIAAEYGITMAVAPGQVSASAWNVGLDPDGDGKILVKWTQPSGSPTNYKIYRGTVSGSLSLYTSASSALEYTDTDLTPGTTYYYQVSAENGVGEGALSTEVSAAPAALTVGMPTLDLEGSWEASYAYQDTARSTAASAPGDPVRCFEDRSGNGRHLNLHTGATAAAFAQAAWEGRAQVQLANSVFAFQGPALALSDCTIFFVGTCDVQDTTQSTLLAAASGSTFALAQTGNRTQFWPSGASGNLVYSSGNPMQIAMRGCVEIQRSGALFRVVGNGHQEDADQAVVTGSITLGYLGGRSDISVPWRGSLMGLYVYSRALNPTELAQARAYIQSQFDAPGFGSYVCGAVHENEYRFQNFPALCYLSSGKYLLAHYDGLTEEGPVANRGKVRRSLDGVDFHEVVLTGNDPARDDGPNFGMTQLASGKIILPWAANGTPRQDGFWKNTTNGDAGGWGSLNVVGAPSGYSYFFWYGTPFLISTTLYQPGYGTRTADSLNDILLFKSTDGGDTWTLHGVVMSATSATLQYTEPTIFNKTGSNWMCVARSGSNNGPLYYVTSSDNCATWNSPAIFKGTAGVSHYVSPAAVVLSTGTIILLAGDRGSGDGTNGIVAWKSTDNGATWSSTATRAYNPPTGGGGLGYPAPIQHPVYGNRVVFAWNDERKLVLIRGMHESEFA